ncbi:MAG: hypothetical protein QOH39_2774 [Verrucomicrobiota bacterium]|jgi:hypothetical protein
MKAKKTKRVVTLAQALEADGFTAPKTMDWLSEQLRFCNSYERLPALLEWFVPVHCRRDGRRAWFRQLGEVWTISDNIGSYRNELVQILSEASPLMRSQMMNEQELARWRELPRQVAVYRGCGCRNRLGLSWTLNPATAARFPFLNRYRVERPLLLTARVPKSNIVAVKLDREEEELIVLVQERQITAEQWAPTD